MSFEDPFSQQPNHGSSSSGQPGVDEGEASDAVSFQRRTSVETEPAEPQQGSADHGHGQAMWVHGFFAKTTAFANKVSTNQASNRSVKVNDSATCKVKRAFLEHIAG